MSLAVVKGANFEIHQTPLESLYFDLLRIGGLKVEFDDINEQRIVLQFVGVRAFRMVDQDTIDYVFWQDNYKGDGLFPNKLLKWIDSPWKQEYIAQVAKKFIRVEADQFSHFVLPFHDYFVEILADRYSVIAPGDIES